MSFVLIATLGAQPQVVTLATQLLLARTRLDVVVVVHGDPSAPPVAQSLPHVREVFAAQVGWPRLLTVPVPVADVLTPDDLDRFSDALYATIQAWLRRGAAIQLLLAGGRKSMALVGLSIAQTLLGPDDAVWLLYSDDALRMSGRCLLQPGDDARLIPVPLPRPAPATARFTPALHAPTRTAALAAMDEQRRRQIQHFLANVLTPAEREVAALFATEVLTVDETAARLHKSPKTITNQLTTIYAKLESAFGLQPDTGVKREFLRRELAPLLLIDNAD